MINAAPSDIVQDGEPYNFKFSNYWDEFSVRCWDRASTPSWSLNTDVDGSIPPWKDNMCGEKKY